LSGIFIRHLPRDWDFCKLFDYLTGLGIGVKRCFVYAGNRGIALAELTEHQTLAQAIAIISRQVVEGKPLKAEPAKHPILNDAGGQTFDENSAVKNWEQQRSKPGQRKQRGRRIEPEVRKPESRDFNWPPSGARQYNGQHA
jgi:hypothetical protein